MATDTLKTKSHPNDSSRQLFRLVLAGMFALFIAFGLLGEASKTATSPGGIEANSRSYSTEPHPVLAQNQTATPIPEFLGRSDSEPPQPDSSQSSATAASAGSGVYIGFDLYPSGAPVRNGDPISNQYPPAIFSAGPYHYPLADSENWGTSLPNSLGRAPLAGFYDGTGYAPLTVQFTTPVNSLRFYADAVDEFRPRIAQVDIFQNNQLTGTRYIDGWGTVFRPVLVDVAAWGFNNVTKIEIKEINDYKGIGFDDFSFTVAPTPTPTPTPQPTPVAPSGLSATLTDRQVRLNWMGSSGATGYYVKRSTTSGGPYTTLAAPQATNYLDPAPQGDTTYHYVVSAFNTNGQSANSNQVSVTIPSACGNVSPVPPTSIPVSSAASGWSMTVEASGNDGVVIRDVSLKGRYMAKSISIPYFKVATTKTNGVVRGELKPNSNDSTLRSRLVKFDAYPADDAFVGGAVLIQAEYLVDRISPTSDSCLRVTQFYAFLGKELTKTFNGGRSCEPSGVVPCEMYLPMVDYSFESRNDELLLSFNAIQRNQFHVNALPFNGIGVFRDCDSLVQNCTYRINTDTLQISQFTRAENPLKTELKGHLLTRGQDAGEWDNIHQTFNSKIFDEPGAGPPQTSRRYYVVSGGCPDCVHMHWRWGRTVELDGSDYGHGSVGFYYPNSTQDMDFAIVKYKTLEQENTEPLDYASLAANRESIRLAPDAGDQILIYYSATGYRQREVFFRHLYFFNPDFGSGTRPIQRQTQGNEANSGSTNEDGPISVTIPHIFEDAPIHFDEFDPNVVAPLPMGYVPYNGIGYNITTHAEASGPYVVSFGIPSATDQTLFNSLRILHAEPDPLDPESGIWVDRTILAPDAQGPDFNGKTIKASVNNFAGFVIVRLVQPQPPNTGTADLSVTTTSAPNPVVAPNTVSYTTTINNAGPNTATGAGLIDSLSADMDFVSASPSQGTCKFVEGSVYCKLDSLTAGGNAVVTIVVKPAEGQTRFPAEGREILNTAFVLANETDPNKDNNSFVKSTTALPNPNAPPVVSIVSPASDARYVGPANITITANASDSDSSIAQVDFYDGDTLCGTGTPAGSNQYVFTLNNVSFGPHSLVAVATDNGGRKSVSSPVNIIVNGPAAVNITSPPMGSVITPHSNLAINANASIASGIINKVDFFANSTLLGTVNGAGQVSVNWYDVPNGKYSLTAVATDGAGITTTSAPVSVIISNRPSVSITSPQDGTSFGASPVLTISTNVQDDDSIIDKVNFYANGTLLGTGFRSGINQFTFTWRGAPDGIFSLTAVATDQHGLTTTSSGITIGVNTPSPRPGEFIWFDDALPVGALEHGEDASNKWHWVDANPGAFSGTKSHQSRSFGQLQPPSSFHQHYFEGAPTTFPVNAGDRLFTYVFLDVNNMPRKITLEWKDTNGWEHRAYWQGHSQFIFYNGTNSKPNNYFMGPLPKPGKWVRLEVPAGVVGLEGAMLNGMSFALEGGRATFDLAGKVTANAPPPPTTPPGDSVWFDDSLPSGAITAVVDDNWNWVTNLAYSGQRSHQTRFDGGADKQFRSHSFTGAQTPMQINPGDVLFTYVYLGNLETTWAPYNAPDQIMIQWYDGTSWEHRAFWGVNFIGTQIANTGVQGTEGQRYMGGLPPVRGWYRLEVPASYVGLEGKSVRGMAFSSYRKDSNPFVAWDRSGKSGAATVVPRNLSATSGVWRSYSSTHGYAFEMHDVPPPEHLLERIGFYVHPNQAAGTVPMHRFRRPGNYEYFYTPNQSGPGSDWQYLGVAFYVYPDGTTPGTVPLHLYHDLQHKYVLTTDYNEAIRFGMGNYDAVWGYVYGTNPQIPFPPTDAYLGGCSLSWRDNSATEVGFKIEELTNGTWNQIATTSANIRHFCVGGASCNEPGLCMSTGSYRVRAYNSFGDSQYSNIAPDQPQDSAAESDEPQPSGSSSNVPPTAEITSLPNSSTTDRSFAINANSFDLQGNGTIVKVEFFVDGSSLGEVWDAPYIFVWNNVPPGTYSLTAVATDSGGASTTSSPVTVTVSGVQSTRTNFALAANGGVASASSTYTPSQGAGYDANPGGTNNGNRSGKVGANSAAWTDNTQNTWSDWLQIDFNGSKTIDERRVYHSGCLHGSD